MEAVVVHRDHANDGLIYFSLFRECTDDLRALLSLAFGVAESALERVDRVVQWQAEGARRLYDCAMRKGGDETDTECLDLEKNLYEQWADTIWQEASQLGAESQRVMAPYLGYRGGEASARSLPGSRTRYVQAVRMMQRLAGDERTWPEFQERYCTKETMLWDPAELGESSPTPDTRRLQILVPIDEYECDFGMHGRESPFGGARGGLPFDK